MKALKLWAKTIAVVLCTSLSSCEYDDTEIWNQVENLLGRVQKLETTCEQQNSNIAALQTLLDGIKNNVYVTSVAEMEGKTGYTLEFSNGEKVEIYHGKDGEDGQTPSVSIVKEGDEYYWSVNGEILKDENGNNISANGGNNGSSPALKTGIQLENDGVEGSWDKQAIYVSVDNNSWTKIVTGDTTQIFTSVEVSENNELVIITLSDGSTISLPKTEKMLSMLYGKWKKTADWDGAIITVTFEEDSSFELIINWKNGIDPEKYIGTFRFIPDRHIQCIAFDTAVNEYVDIVFSIVEMTENSLTMNGSDMCEGTFTRIVEDTDENIGDNSSSDADAVMIGTWNCKVYNEDGEVEESYTMTFKEDGTLSLDYDKPVIQTTWSYSEEEGLHIVVLHTADPIMSATDYSATIDDSTTPKTFSGNCCIWNYTSNGLYTTTTDRKFLLTKTEE